MILQYYLLDCLPILLHELGAVPVSNATLLTLQSTWKVVMYKILHLKNKSDPLRALLYSYRYSTIIIP